MNEAVHGARGTDSSASPLAEEGSREAAGEGLIALNHPSPGGEAPPPSPARGEGGKSAAGLRRLARILWVVMVLGAGVAVWYGLFRDSGPKDDLGRLQGDWTYSTDGRNNRGVIRVEGDTWTYYPAGQLGRSYRVTLKPDASPKEIDLAQLGDVGRPVANTHGLKGSPVGMHGVYAIDGDTLRVRLAPMVEPRPASLDDGDIPVLTLKKEKR